MRPLHIAHDSPHVYPGSNKRIETLAARLVEPNNPRNRAQDSDDDDDEALFAELEAEIENDGSYAMREQGLEVLKRE